MYKRQNGLLSNEAVSLLALDTVMHDMNLFSCAWSQIEQELAPLRVIIMYH